MNHLKANWKKYALTAGAAAAGYYGGPAGVEAGRALLAALGLL